MPLHVSMRKQLSAILKLHMSYINCIKVKQEKISPVWFKLKMETKI